MFWQHYLEIKKSILPVCISEQVYASILKSSKNKDLFQDCHTYPRQIFEISLEWFL